MEKPIQQSYRELVNEAITYRLRVTMALAVPAWLFFSVLDHFVYPGQAAFFLLVRLLVSGIYLLTFIVVTGLPSARRWAVWLSDVPLLATLMAIVYMIHSTNGALSNYYHGINVVFLVGYTVNSFFMSHHIGVGLITLASYLLAVLTNPVGFRPPETVSALFFMGFTVFFVALSAKFYRIQHHREFVRTQEVRQTADALVDANRRLREAERTKDDFFANVSHELRTPLTLTLAPVESLLIGEYGQVSERQGQALQVVHNNAVRLLQMVNGLLDFSKLEAGKLEVHREPAEIVKLTQLILGDFRPLAQRKKQTLSFTAVPPEAAVEIDSYLYDRILFNLLSNATKFTPDGGRITVALRVESGTLTLRVSDTGIGIAPSDLPHLFQKFRQLESSSTRRFEGTGLGLALVKEFCSLLGGTVSVESQLGQGTVFTVKCAAPPAQKTAAPIQRQPAHVQVAGNERKTAEALREETPGKEGRPRVLIVEDNRPLADYIADLLGAFCQTRIVENGEEALAVAQDWLPELVLSDVMMPGLSGLDLCQRLKANAKTRKIAVVLLTALTHREALLKGWEAGADEYLFKPFHPKELVTRIKSMLSALLVKKRAEEILLRQRKQLQGLLVQRRESERILREERDQLQRMNQIMMEREGRIVELKSEVNGLSEKLGQPRRYH